MAGIRLEWAQFGDFDSFDVIRSDAPMDINALPSPIATNLSTMYYVDITVVEGATYYYRIAAWRDAVSNLSEEIKVSAGNDIYWVNVVTLLNFKNNIIDEKSKTWTPAVTPVFSSNRFKLTGNYIKTPYSTDFDWVNNEFTIEAFVNAASWSDWSLAGLISGISKFISHCNTDNDLMNWSFGPIASGKARVYYWDGAQRVLITSTNSIQLNKDVHISFSIDASKAYISVDGIVDVVNRPASIIMSHSIPNIVIGNYYYSGVSGFCGGVRFTKGVARYTANFTPPVAPFPTTS